MSVLTNIKLVPDVVASMSAGAVTVLSLTQMRLRAGAGWLAGEFPAGITSVDGTPASAEVRVLVRKPSQEYGDGVLVAVVQSAADGTWRVDGLDPSQRYDVVGRKSGFNDVIMSNVKPVVP